MEVVYIIIRFSFSINIIYYGVMTSLYGLKVMKEFKVKNLVMSSSATVYGTPQALPLTEKHPVGGCTNPYGKTKLFMEEIMQDVYSSDNVSILIGHMISCSCQSY